MQKPVRTQTQTHDDTATHELPAYFRGRQEQANYTDTGIWRYQGNPLNEALGRILTEKEASKLLAYYPPYSEDERKLPGEMRVHLTHTVLDLFVTLPVHIDLEQKFSCSFRNGYVHKNPLLAGHYREIGTAIENWDQHGKVRNPPPIATGFNVVGISGGGKSSGTERVLYLYPQVIYHSAYQGRPFTFVQIVWLKMSCPFDASTRALCIDFFKIVDDLIGTNYYQRFAKDKTTDQMLPSMARVAALHGMGGLIIDEVQFLSESSSGGPAKMLNFFCDLTNRVNMPVVCIGTYKALNVLSREFRQIRRGCGEGEKRWERLLDAKTWRFFLNSVWRYQYVKRSTPLTDELCSLFFDLTQGIPDLCIKLYMLSQIRAIRTGIETITQAVVRSVARDCFVSAEPVLDALRRNDTAALELISDVHSTDISECIRALDKAADSSSLISPGKQETGKRRSKASCKINAEDAGSDTRTEKRSADPEAARPPGNTSNQGSVLSGNPKDQSGYDKLKGMGYIRSGTEFLDIDRAA